MGYRKSLIRELRSEAIFFDGLLPLSKKPTRLSRLQNYANQLVSFRAVNKDSFPPPTKITPASVSSPLASVTPSSTSKALPAPSFLVPAVIEAVLSSPYSHLASVIPGEADAYCAESAKKLGGVIFTSDSDLLVHDLGDKGRVILFRDLETIHLPSKGACLKTQVYHPFAIAEKFGLQNLVRVAYFMSQGSHRGFNECVKLAKEQNPTSVEFTDFAMQYGSLPVLSKLAAEYLTHSDRPVFRLLSRLDPRISELIHQISIKQDASDSLDMYLPFSVDDPTRTSAWRTGVQLRVLAYSMLKLLDPNLQRISEYERKGTRIADTTVELYGTEELLSAMDALLGRLRSALTTQQRASLSAPAQWRALAAELVCESSIENGKPQPPSVDLVRLILGSREGPLSWQLIHASAQHQAAVYSLRLLHQTTEVVVAFLNEQGRSSDPTQSMQELVGLLGKLPSLSELLDCTATPPAASESDAAKTAVADMLRGLGVSEIQGEETASAKRKRKRKKKGGQASETSPPAWRGNNMFGSLA